MYLIHRIEELAATYEDSRRTIAEFALSEHARLPELTIADVARETYTSKASVTRFAKALGFDGWREFLREFVREDAFERQHAQDVDVNYPFVAGDSDARILENIGNLMAESVAATYAQLDRGMLAMAVRHLQRAERVWVFGRTPNHYCGESFCRKLLAIGKQATAVSPGDMGIVARSLGPDDCAIVISYSGNNADANPMAQVGAMIANRVRLIALTSGGNNYLRKTVPCVLTIASRERLYSKIANFSTEESVSYLLNVLFSCYFARDYEKNLQTKLVGGRALEEERLAVLKEISERR